jgi:hypothetical protein
MSCDSENEEIGQEEKGEGCSVELEIVEVDIEGWW